MTRIHILPLPWIVSLVTLMANLPPTQTNAQSCGGKITHQDKTYATVQVGNQCWLAENLQATVDAEGAPIPLLVSPEAWSEQLLSPALCEVEVHGQSKPVILYNRWAAAKACPQGWHLPTLEEWDALATHLGGWQVAGYSMKSRTGWPSVNNRTNRSRFNAKPHGLRDMEGEFNFQGEGAYWWTDSDNDLLVDCSFVWIEDGTMDLYRHSFLNTMGFSVRCVQNEQRRP